MNLQKISDKAAIALSMLCVVHCLLLPVLLLLLPALAGALAFDDALFHKTLLFFVVPISVVALMMGYFYHRNHTMLLIGGVGLSLLILAVVLGHDILGEYGEVVLTVIGSSFIAFSHIRNLRLRRQTESDSDYPHIITHK
ncbi:MerC domain-containing protein [Alteromonas sp. 1_MG-2023]|uniref:MerC domain-containing protein n=1 Tax=Alteromonas sp. 1_MG-2023 TaxID=3062669 RepID=UPI0026E1E4E9|nr:MerC domain-containing protein [Alteromonas sp. 1_MG-2023]MDO6566980.1 MerC domain-containing protein [Alteromonas sp. 1_MG-2023]